MPPLVVDVVDRRRSWRQVCFIVVVIVVVVVVVPIVIVGVLVADQCRGNTNTSSCTKTHSGTALKATQRETELMKPRPPLAFSNIFEQLK